MVLTSFKQTQTNIEQTFNETVEANDNINNKRRNRRHDTTVTRTLDIILIDRAWRKKTYIDIEQKI